MAQPATNPKIEELRFRLKTDPKNRIFYPLAEELRKIGQLAEAEQVLRTGLSFHPTYLSAWVSLGRVLRDEKNDGAAVEALSKALQLDPGNVVAARLLADAYLTLGEKVEAIKKYKLVQALMPGDEEVDGIVDTLDAELNPRPEPEPAQPVAETQPPLAAAPFMADDQSNAESPFAQEESPFAPEPEITPPHATTEMAFPHEFESAAAATPFAPSPETGEETLTMRRPKREAEGAATDHAPEDPFADSALAAEPSFETPGTSLGAHEADDALTPPPASASDTETPLWPASDANRVFDDAEQSLHREIAAEKETGDDIPMSAEHAESPFEEPTTYGAAAFEIEAPDAMHVVRGPVAADLPLEAGGEELPPPDMPPFAPEASASGAVDESDVFAPAAEPQADVAATSPPPEDLTNTLTMADLYARQGLVSDARQIYENILHRDPQNEAVRAKLEALSSQLPQTATETAGAGSEPSAEPAMERDEKKAKLERWLSKVGKREVGSV